VRFKRETEFQDTEIGKIPKEWKVVKLKDIATKIKMGGTPKRTVKEYWNGEIPFAKIEDITNSGKYLLSTSSTITRLGLENSNAWLVPMNSLLITIYGTLGMVIINKIEVATNQAIVGVIPKRELVDVEFLYYWYLYYQPNWIKFVKKSTQPNLTLEIVANSKLPLPSLAEQKVIAEILSTVDRAIEVVDAAVVRLEGLKKALINKLLTGRVRVKEENGKLVFDKETEFQETEIGEIPKEWKIVKLKEILTLRNGKRPTLSEDGWIPVYGANGIMGYTADFLIDNDYTIVIGRVGASGEVHLAQGKIWVSDNALYSEKFNSSKVFMPFLYYLLKDKKLSRFAHKTTHPIITQSFLNNLPIQLPSLAEQRIIADILLTIDRAIELYYKEKDVLGRLKKGLMDVLLTGKVRVGRD
jgi:type I restriction enzyme S subunit